MMARAIHIRRGGGVWRVTIAGAALPAMLLALNDVSPLAAQEVVQPLPPREAGQLNAALRKLSSRPNDLEALLSAGNASLALRDTGAAAGFFARAAATAPADPRVMLGTARVALAQRRPVEALQAFGAAEQAGVRSIEMAADRGLAYDLVGDPASAQNYYRSILASGDSAEVRLRLALSYAIAGNRTEFERVLYPLLKAEDRSAFRTRAFGLAILGRTDEAVAIADAMMTTDLALRMAPYLRYMPRLTKAQQAAAGNLGAFPAAAEIGRDSPEIERYASAGAQIAARGSNSLTPAGVPLGTRSEAPQQGNVRRRPDPIRTVPPSRREAQVARTETVRVLAPTAVPAPAPAPAPVTVRAPAPAAMRTAELSPVPTPVSIPAPAPTPVRVAELEPVSAPARGPSPASTPGPTAAPSSSVVVAAAPAALPAAEPERPSLDDAFAEFGATPTPRTAPAPDAVDMVKLAAQQKVEDAKAAKLAEAKAAREKAAAAKLAKEKAEVAAKEKAEKAAKAADPARFWLQVGVGRNVSAFGFDWKKLAKEAGGALDGKGPWAVKYGATNRMLAGPYPTEAAARAALKKLKDKGIDALPFNSGAGEKVTKAG